MKRNNIVNRNLQRIFYLIFGFILLKVKKRFIRFYGPTYRQVNIAYFHVGELISKDFKILKKHLDRKDSIKILDIGGNIGWMALKLYNILNSNRIEFVMVEPVPENQFYLEKNLKHLNYQLIKKGISHNEKFINLGINNIDGDKTKDTGLYSYIGSVNKVKVPCVKIDDIVDNKTQIDLIKIDIEGMELDALKSAENTLRRSNGLLLFVEINKKIKDEFKDISSFLKQLGYKNLNPESNDRLKFDSIWHK